MHSNRPGRPHAHAVPANAARRLLPRARRRLLSSAFFALNLAVVPGSPAVAGELPSGGAVTSGAASIAGTADRLTISQSSHHAIIGWDSFSIGAGNLVTFDNGSGATLNRVTGSDVSSLFGTLTATGDLFLINRNGIVVGPDGIVETGGSFVASTLDIGDADFLDGGDTLFAGDGDATVYNLGKVASLGGDVALIARSVVNAGSIEAEGGTVGLVAGREVLMRDAALDDGLFSVRIGDADSSVTERGMIAAASAELRAHGGNVYALAGNDGGTISASGVSASGGRVFLTAGGGGVAVAKTVRAERNGDGGDIFINADIVSIAGLLEAIGSAGGTIDIGASDAITLAGATLDTSGVSMGGTVRIGGEFQGGNRLDEDEVANADYVTVDADTAIDAGASNGDGGMVVLWSEEETVFAGSILAIGGAGGFVEVSSRGHLVFTGMVDTGGGTLLLDPDNIVIGDGTDYSGYSQITVSTLTDALGGNDVVVSTSHGTETDEGHIVVTSDVGYASAYDLTLLAHGNILLLASIQNDYDPNPSGDGSTFIAGGDINLIAGWNGSSGFSASGGLENGSFDWTSFDTSVGGGAFGNSYGDDGAGTYYHGSVFVGDGTQTSGIAVGSRSGATNVYGYDVALAGSGTKDEAHAQIGYRVTDRGGSHAVTGDIAVAAVNDISATGGDAKYAFAQIGHVGMDGSVGSVDEAMVSDAAIAATAGRDLTLAGGSSNFFSYAQLGHGGSYAYGDYSGAITIDTGGDLTIKAGDKEYAQLGHGGYFAVGDYSGATTVDVGGDLSLTGGAGNSTYAQLGHGGYFADGDHSGTITVDVAVDLSLTGGDGDGSYAQLGHGDASGNAFGNRSEAATMVVSGTTMLTAGIGADARAWLGHYIYDGSYAIDGGLTLVTHGLSTSGIDLGALLASAWAGGDVLIANAAVVGGSGDYGISVSGSNVSVATDHDLTLLAGGDIDVRVAIQNGYDPDPNNDGNFVEGGALTLIAGWDGSTGVAIDRNADGILRSVTLDPSALTGDANTFGRCFTDSGSVETCGSVFVGDGTQTSGIAVGSRSGATNVYGYDVALAGSVTTVNAHAQIGYRATDQRSSYHVTGDITVTAVNDVTLTGGDADHTYAQIGHVGADRNADGVVEAKVDADISVLAGNDLLATGGNSDSAYAQIGHGGQSAIGDFAGAIAVEVSSGDMQFAGGSRVFAYAQVGHGGFGAGGDHSGSIDVAVATGSVTFTADDDYAYVQLGHGGINVPSRGTAFYNAGDIALDVGGNLTFLGKGNESYAQLGHRGGFGANALAWIYNSGDITSDIGGDLTLTGGDGSSYAQIGHGDASGFAYGGQSGAIAIVVSGATTLTDGMGSNARAWLGHHPGSARTDSIDGGLTLVTHGLSTSGIDLGALLASAWAGGDVLIANAAVVGGSGDYGISVSGSDVSVATDHDLTLLAGGDIDVRVAIQNGYDPDPNNDGNFVEGGDLTLIAGWDGSTGVAIDRDTDGILRSVTLDPGAITGDANTFGRCFTDSGSVETCGSVFVGDGTQTSGIAVGSRSGATNVYGYDVALAGSGTKDEAYAQIGYRATDQGSSHAVTGDIAVAAVNDVSTTGGDAKYAYAQIGHVGTDGSADTIDEATVSDAAIAVAAGRDLILTGGGNRAYAQLGHGGYGAVGEYSGALTIDVVGRLSVAGGGAKRAYAHLGHGGYLSVGDHSGAITVDVAGALSVSGGSGERAYAHLGHGGFRAVGDHSGALTVDVGGDLSISGGSTTRAYAQLGHGGIHADGDHSGAMAIAVDGGLSLMGGSSNFNYAQLGHGSASDFVGSGDRSGHIMILVGEDTTLANGTGSDVRAWLGHMIDDGYSIEGGLTLVTHGLSSSGIDLGALLASAWAGGDVLIANAAIAGGSDDYGLTVSGSTIDVETDHDLTLLAGGDVDVEVSIRNGYFDDTGATEGGAVNLVAGWDGSTGVAVSYDSVTGYLSDVTPTLEEITGGTSAYGQCFGDGSTATCGSVIVGGGGQTTGIAVGSRSGATNVYGYDVTLTGGGEADKAFAQIGYRVSDQGEDHYVTGDITVGALNDVTLTGGGANFTHAQIGHVGADTGFDDAVEATVNADINVVAGNDLLVTGGNLYAYAQLGHGGYVAVGEYAGSVAVAVTSGDMVFSGGSGLLAYAQAGHGGYLSEGDRSGSIDVAVWSGDLIFSGGSGGNTYAQLGHGGSWADGDRSGSLNVSVENGETAFTAGDGYFAHVQLGHGGVRADGDNEGDIVLDTGGALTFSGNGVWSYAQLGHGGGLVDGDHSGSIDVTVSDGDMTFTAGNKSSAYAQLGHGGYSADGDHSGDIAITVSSGGLILTGGSAWSAYAQVGHGDASGIATGGRSGILRYSGGAMTLIEGSGTNARALFGHY